MGGGDICFHPMEGNEFAAVQGAIYDFKKSDSN